MRLFIFGIAAFLTAHFAIGQETKIVTVNSDGFIEEYSVLISDQRIKHGNYQKFKGKGQLVMEGTYDNNRKTSEWKFYTNGELDQTYDFSAKKLKYARKPDHKYKVLIDGKIQEIELDTPPLYLGSKAELSKELNKVMKYPAQARRMGTEGKVSVSFWIDRTDNISDIKIVQGITVECNSEVRRGLGVVEKNWVAGTVNGQKVKAQFFVVVEFKLHDRGLTTITVL